MVLEERDWGEREMKGNDREMGKGGGAEERQTDREMRR